MKSEFNDVNGGSFSVTATKTSGNLNPPLDVRALLDRETESGLDSQSPYVAFAERVAGARVQLIEFVRSAREQGKTVAALGASTKGNVILQYCGFTGQDIECVGEVNVDKFGCFTPGSLIPIIPEQALVERAPDYAIILPWHFRRFFLANPKLSALRLVVPLPQLELL